MWKLKPTEFNYLMASVPTPPPPEYVPPDPIPTPRYTGGETKTNRALNWQKNCLIRTYFHDSKTWPSFVFLSGITIEIPLTTSMTAMTTSTTNEGRTVTSQVIPVAHVASTKSFAAAAALVEKQLLNQQSNANGGEGGPLGSPPDLSRQSMAVKLRNRNRSTNDYLGKPIWFCSSHANILEGNCKLSG